MPQPDTAVPDAPAVMPRAGFTFTPRRFRFDRAAEERMLSVTGAGPRAFGGCIDPAAVIPHAIREAVLNGITANGMVNMVQRIVMDAPLDLDDELEVTGRVAEVHPTPRGLVWICDTDYAPAGGGPGIRTRRTALMTDPSVRADPGQRGTLPRPEPAVTDPEALRTLATVEMTPDDCLRYCGDTTNLIHTDPDFARNAGYRAPIVGGSHGVRYMTAALWQARTPRRLDVEIMFRRPIFWDDTFDIRLAESDGDWTALCTARAGKVLSEMRINSLG